MNNNWKNIWEKKGLENIDLERDEFLVFCDLKKADGFDVNVHNEQLYFKAFYDEWMKMYKKLNEIAENSIQSVFEVGCGSGVNLYLFRNRIKDISIGGIDYSQGLINIAKSVVPSEDLVCGNAEDMYVDAKYDLVMADSVFQYFGSQEYAADILNKMILKSNKVVYVSEMHNVDFREEWLEYRRNSMDDYDQIYKGLDKLFYSKDWVLDIARRNGKQVLFSKSENPEYWNSKYVFNCFIF